MSPLEALLVVGAGGVAGAANAVAGGGTLLTFPTLLAVGVPAVEANTTTAVGLMVGYASGVRSLRPELADQGARVRALLPAALLGTLVGTVLLLGLPSDGFEAVVPFLLLAASALIAVQPRLARVLTSRGIAGEHAGWEAQLGVGLACVYGGYFGAGLGVILFAVVGLLVPDDPLRTNALRSVLGLTTNAAAAAVFVATGHVDWVGAVALGLGAWFGAGVGVRFARRLPAQAVRAVVVVLGAAVGVALLLR